MPAQSAIRRGVEFPLCEFGGGEFPVAGAEGAAGIGVEEEWVGSGIRGNKNPVPEREITSTGELREKFLLLNFADLGVAEGHDVAVVLKADVALGGLAEVFELFEFGSGDALVPVVRTFDVFDILGAVHAAISRDRRIVPQYRLRRGALDRSGLDVALAGSGRLVADHVS